MESSTTNWRAVAAKHQEELRAKIPQPWRLPDAILSGTALLDLAQQSGILDDHELSIINARAVDLLAGLREQRLKAVDVVRAFCKAAAIAQQATNCVAAILFDEALDQAAQLDEYIQVHGRPKGLLHGLPVSVKEHVHVRGTKATCGMIAWANHVSDSDAVVVQALRAQGAIIHVKTTNPQTLLAIETDSNLFGRTVNPHNRDLSCGGSTGGEGALIAMRGSVVGVGTDIGGSIRVPSAFCGTYGLKPSVARLPHGGLAGLHDGMQNIIGVVGPLGRCVDDLAAFCAAVLAQEPWRQEPSLIEMPWKGALESPPRLKIGVIWDDGVVQPHPPVTRTVTEVVAALERDGHQTVRWNSDIHKDLVSAVEEAYFLDGGQEYREALDRLDPPVPILQWALDHMTDGRVRTVQETWELNARIERLRTQHVKQWYAAGIDVLLSPVNASAASGHDESRYWGYSSVVNALDLPALVIPVGRVRPSDTWERFPAASSTTMSPMDEYYRGLYHPQTGPAKYRNAPVGIQLVGRRLQEEQLLEVGRTIEKSITKVEASTTWAV